MLLNLLFYEEIKNKITIHFMNENTQQEVKRFGQGYTELEFKSCILNIC